MIPIQIPLINGTDMTVSFLRYQSRKSARRVQFLCLHHLKVTQESLNLRQQRDSLGRRPFLNSFSGFKSPDSMSIRKWLFIFFIPQREKKIYIFFLKKKSRVFLEHQMIFISNTPPQWQDNSESSLTRTSRCF